MSMAVVIEALGIPAQARVDRRVPKSLLLEHGRPTAADRRRIQEGVEEIRWVAALKPTNIGVPEGRDAEREYLEVAVLAVTLRANAKAPRVIELVHRAIPYPVLLVAAEPDGTTSVSVAHKRSAQNEAGKVVVERVWRAALADSPAEVESTSSFLASIPVAELPAGSLLSLYQGWVDCVAAMEASRTTGVSLPPRPERASVEIDAVLQEHSRLLREVASLRAQAKKEKQISRRVDINTRLKELQAELTKVRGRLKMRSTP